MTAAPAFGDHRLSPVQPVTISVAHGRISTLTLTGPHGRQVAGTFAPDRTSWTLREPLGYGQTYTVTGTALGTDGRTIPITGRYTTVTPADRVNTSISPGDGAVVGVAAPVIVHLGSNRPTRR